MINRKINKYIPFVNIQMAILDNIDKNRNMFIFIYLLQ